MTQSQKRKGKPPAPGRKRSKKDQLIKLLRRDGGASLDEMAAATKWLPHTVRAMLTGLRKKGFSISRQTIDNVSRYSIEPEARQ